ncbi:acetyl-CoA C-acetyltransferase [soil metagenome]
MQTHDTRRVAVIGGVRIPFSRAYAGYADCTNQQMLTAALKAVVDRYELRGQRIGDVGAGAILKYSADWNLTREAVLGSGLARETPAFDLQRACGTSLETTIMIANKIALNQIDCGIAGGVDTISDAPVVYPREYQRILVQSARGRSLGARLKPWLRLRPKHFQPVLPAVVEPRTGLDMGQSTERMAKEWNIPRENQDRLALESHRKAAAAWDEGFYDDLVASFNGVTTDGNIRGDTSLEKLAELRAVYDRGPSGTLTAGNSTPLTDGAAAVLLSSEQWALDRGLPVQAWLTHARVAAVDYIDREGLLMAPAYAVSQMLEQAGRTLQDFSLYEIHEAFAAQVLATFKAWESPEFCRDRLGRDVPLGAIDRSRLNVKGGSIAIGHPFAATGARIVATLAKLLSQQGTGRGLISVCTAGGMGVTAILERD